MPPPARLASPVRHLLGLGLTPHHRGLVAHPYVHQWHWVPFLQT
jgi:hypothetical protein